MSDHILTDDMLINGMPCHRYILRGLMTTVDAISFQKTYANTMRAVGASHEEIAAALPLLTLKLNASSPIAGFDFSVRTNQNEAFSFIDSISFDDDVPTYRTCDKFYKKFNKKRNACCLCPLSDKYLNQNLKIEETVLAYALSSPEAYQYLLENKVTHEHFKSVLDVMVYFSYPEAPSCYPLFSQTFLALSHENIRDDYYRSKEQGRPSPEMIAYHDDCLRANYISHSLLSPEMTERLEAVLTDELEKLPCPAESEIDLLILRLLNPDIANGESSTRALKEGGKITTQIADSSNMGLGNLDQFYENPPVAKKKRKTTKGTSAHVVDVQQQTVENIQYEIPIDTEDIIEEVTLTDFLGEGIHNQEGAIVNADVNPAKAAVEATPGVTSQDSAEDDSATYEKVQDAEIVDELPGKSGTYYSVPEQEIVITEIADSAEVPRMIREAPGDSLIVLPVVPMHELSHFALCLDSENIRLLSMFESYVLKDKRLSMELIQTDERTVFLLLYSPRMRAYLYTDLGSNIVKEVLVPMLEHGSISKYCYFPYTTLSALWKMGIYAKGVYSLFSMSALLYGDHRLDMEIVLEKMGATKAVGGITMKPCGDITSIPLNYMHAYANIYHRCRHEINKRGFLAEYEDRNHFDKVLSYSYYQDRFIEDGSVLFTMSTANGYRFQTASAAPKSGYMLLRYTFKNNISISSQLVRDLLIRLDDAGRFRKWRMFISSVGINSFALCIRKKDHVAMTTILNTSFLAYIREKELTGIEYYLEET